MAAQVLHGASLELIFRRLVDSFHIAALDIAELEACQIWGKQWIKLLELLYEAGTVSIDSKTAVRTSTLGTKAGGNANEEA